MELLLEGYSFEVPEPGKEKRIDEGIILHLALKYKIGSESKYLGVTRVLSF